MVGVAGKSKACNTCRKRRIKCDLGRPFCQKCITSNRACSGYDRDLIFVNRTPTEPWSTATSVLSDLKAQQHPKGVIANQRAEDDLRILFAESFRNCQRFRKYAVELLNATYLPNQPNIKVGTADGSFSWVCRLADLIEPSKALDSSIFAFCLAQLFVTGTGKSSLDDCLDQYNAALGHLCFDLDNAERRFQEETVAAILVLSTCELFVCPTQDGWSVHARGIAEILRLRDRGMTGTPAWRHLLSRLRVVCTLEGLTKRRSQFLENDVWRQMVIEPSSNDALDEVFRMLVDIPSLLERATTLPLLDGQSLASDAAAVVHSMLATIKALESWQDGFWKVSSSPRVWSVPSRATNMADADFSDKIFPQCFEFESLAVAVPAIMCWSVVTQLCSNIIQIHDLLRVAMGRQMELKDILDLDSDILSGVSSQVGLPITADTVKTIEDIKDKGTRMAHNVCKSMEYFHRIEMGTYGGHAKTYPSWSARQYFRLHPGHERERFWLQNMHKMEGPGQRWGHSIMAFEDIAEPLAGS